MPPSIVVQTQIRLRNSARTVAFRGATAKIQIISFLSFFFMSLTISSLELPGIMIIFFRFPCNFEIEVSPLIQTTPVSTKKITVEGMGFFFQFPIKGEREGRERSKKRAIEQQLATSRSSSRGSFFSGYQGTPRTYFNL